MPRRRNSRRAIHPARSTPQASSRPYQRGCSAPTRKMNGLDGLGIASRINAADRSPAGRGAVAVRRLHPAWPRLGMRPPPRWGGRRSHDIGGCQITLVSAGVRPRWPAPSYWA